MSNLESLRANIRHQAGNRCGYCLAHQEHLPWTLELEHIIPTSRGGTDDEDNLWLACHACNLYKGSQVDAIDPLTGRRVALFNPRQQRWKRHFQWSEDGLRIIGRTASGRATVIALNLNNLVRLTVRRNWVKAGWHPPTIE
jgi:hypothetical protein